MPVSVTHPDGVERICLCVLQTKSMPIHHINIISQHTAAYNASIQQHMHIYHNTASVSASARPDVIWLLEVCRVERLPFCER